MKALDDTLSGAARPTLAKPISPKPWREDMRRVEPMLATLADASLTDPERWYEPKLDGIRALATYEDGRVQLLSRGGNDKAAQFPEVVQAVAALGKRVGQAFILDGEIVALDKRGRALGFEALQPRMHLRRARDVQLRVGSEPVAYMVFDLLRAGDEDVRSLPLVDRRARLEGLVGPGRAEDKARNGQGVIRLVEGVRGQGQELLERMRNEGGEGLLIKEVASRYESGRRSPAWRKMKLTQQQEFVIGGWTESRAGRTGPGALLLGLAKPSGKLQYVGHVGSGFSDETLAALSKTMGALERKTCPFESEPPSNERPHWIMPTLVAEVRFGAWTDGGMLRHPVYLGLRRDKAASAVVREEKAVPGPAQSAPLDEDPVSEALGALAKSKAPGRLVLPDGHKLDVTNLGKPYWPALGISKGDLLRYYWQVSAFILPVVADRPLVMRRFPDGIEKEAFYQQKAPDKPPAGVRVETVADDDDVAQRLVGGDLVTLLYMAQLGVISQDPWFSRVPTPDEVDQIAFDLDPMPDVSFEAVLDVARWIHEELELLGVRGFPKTSGASGLHIFVSLPPGTSYEAGRLFAQLVSTMVARKHPKVATVERTVNARGKTVYIDYLQNIRGKTLACAYSARASDYAGASTPLTWDEVHEGVDPHDFTIRTLPERLRTVGDLWAGLRSEEHRVDLHATLERLSKNHKRKSV